MAYVLKEVTIRTNNSPAGMEKIASLWQDVQSGKLPLLFDSEGNFLSGVSPVSRYSAYSSDETGDYDLSIVGVAAEFFTRLTADKSYRKYEASGDSPEQCAQSAWEQVWKDAKAGTLRRAYTQDYESAVPAAYAKDGKAHCYLYIAVL